MGITGSQMPRIWHSAGVEGTLGREAVDLSASAGLDLDPWQAWFMEHACSVSTDPEDQYFNKYTKRTEPKWANFEVAGIVARQNGKGPLSVTTPLLTVTGWTTMGSVRPGEHVYGSDGRPTRVVAVSEVYSDDDCYAVEFQDGSKFIAGADHLWHVSHKGRPWRDLRTGYLASRIGSRRPDNGRMEYNWRVRCDAVPDAPECQLPVDPYLLGYWLGDGTSTGARITVGHQDKQWTMDRVARCGVLTSDAKLHDHGRAWSFGFYGMLGQLRTFGILNNKRIPEVYLTASIEQRKQLLAGLMDSDGSVATTNKSPQVEFTTSIPGLADDFLRLARSLGIRVTRRDGKTGLNGVRKKDRARFLWTPTFNPFQMPRKAEKWRPPTSRRHEVMSIVSITPVPTVPTRCIQVDAEDGVYLVGRLFTPTHNSILEARELAGLFLFGERLMIHTAHLFKTSNAAFERVAGLISDSPHLNKHLKAKGGILHTSGMQGIYLKNGQALQFATRGDKQGRGLTADWVGLDESMYLPAEQLGALMPTMASRPNAQLWYTGSAGDIEIGDCSQIGRVRTRAVEHGRGAEGLFFAEWSIDRCNDFCPKPDQRTGEFKCDQHDDPSRPESWAKANPGQGIRISVKHIEKEYNSLDFGEFLRERLSVGNYPVEGEAWKVIPKDKWEGRTNSFSQIDGPYALGIDTTPGREYTALAVCGLGLNSGGLEHVEITSGELDGQPFYDHRPGAQWVVDRVVQLWNGQNPPYTVVVDQKSQAGSFIDELERAGVRVTTVNGNEYAQGCGEFRESVCPQGDEKATLVHLGQPPLAVAVAQAEKRVLMDSWAWSKRSSSADISPLVAATLALWGRRHVEVAVKSEPWLSFGWDDIDD